MTEKNPSKEPAETQANEPAETQHEKHTAPGKNAETNANEPIICFHMPEDLHISQYTLAAFQVQESKQGCYYPTYHSNGVPGRYRFRYRKPGWGPNCGFCTPEWGQQHLKRPLGYNFERVRAQMQLASPSQCQGDPPQDDTSQCKFWIVNNDFEVWLLHEYGHLAVSVFDFANRSQACYKAVRALEAWENQNIRIAIGRHLCDLLRRVQLNQQDFTAALMSIQPVGSHILQQMAALAQKKSLP